MLTIYIKKTIISYYPIDNDFCKVKCINGNLDWLIIYDFYKPFYNDKDWVINLAFLITKNW